MKLLRHPFILPCLVFLLAFALFAPSLPYGFVFLDDPVFLVNNPIVFNGFSWASLGQAFTGLHADEAMYTPLLWISYLLDNLFFGASPVSPWGYHLGNVFFHAANATLLSCILFFAIRRPLPAFLGTLVWALHPLRVESVAWLTERKDTLSTLFALASILAYLHARRTGASRPRFFAGLSFLFFVLGLLSKPMLVTLPFLFLLLDFWPLGRFSLRETCRSLPRLVLEKWPYFLLVAVVCVVTYRLQTKAIATLPLQRRLFFIPVNYLFYLSRTIYPVSLSPMTPGLILNTFHVLVSCGVFVLLALAAFRLLRRAPGFAVGLLAFAGLLFPVSGIVPIGMVPVADRYSYLPAIGLSLALAVLLADAIPGDATRATLLRRASATVVAIALIPLTAVSLHLLPSWENPQAFAARVGQVVPDHPLAVRSRFSDDFYKSGDLAAAARDVEILWKSAPSSSFAVFAKVLVLSQTDSPEAAMAFFRDNPIAYPESSVDDALAPVLAALCAEIGDLPSAERHIADSIAAVPRLYPKYAELNLSVAFWFYASRGLADRARPFAEKLPSVDATDPLAIPNFFHPLTGLWNIGLRKQALAHLLDLAGKAGDNPALLNNIAWLLATAPNSPAPPGKVLSIARRAFDRHPEHPVLRDTLAVALAFDGRFDEALAEESAVADFLRSSTAADAPAMLANVEKRIALFRDRTPYVEDASLKLLFSSP